MPIGPHSVHGVKRSAARYRPDRADDAHVEIDLVDGSRWKIGLLEVSTSGICFRLEQDSTALSAGTIIEMATISAGTLKSTGAVRVVYATSEFAAGTVCGAEFVPRTEADKQALSQFLARLEEKGLRSG